MYNARARRPVPCVNVLCGNRSVLESVRCGVPLCVMGQLWKQGTYYCRPLCALLA